MNPLSTLGNLFTGSGWRTGTGLGLFVAGPLVKSLLGIDTTLGEVYDNLALGLAGGGVIGKIANVMAGRTSVPHVVRPPSPPSGKASPVALAVGAVVGMLVVGVWMSCSTRVTARPPHVPSGLEDIVDSHLPAQAQPDSVYLTAILSTREEGVAVAVPVIAAVTGDHVVYFAIPTTVRTVPDSTTATGEFRVLWYSGIPVLEATSSP